MTDQPTIVAVATPPGIGALAILRVSGPESHPIVCSIAKNAEKFMEEPARAVGLFTFINPENKKPIDEGTVIKYLAPRSFTGEDMVEIICHGGKRVVEELMAALIVSGAKPAGRGAFTRRALENGKINLMKAEAIRGMIESRSEAELLCAKKMYDGETRGIMEWRERIVSLLSDLEVEIEFEEDVHVTGKKVRGKEQIKSLISAMREDLKKREKFTTMEQGITVVIAGPANAGKSTLFNTIVGFRRAIVHHEPGTTRDLVSEGIRVNGHDLVLIDSAGLRETTHEVEISGINFSRKAIVHADIILWVTAADEPLTEKEKEEICSLAGKTTIGVINKNDRADGTGKMLFMKQKNIETVSISLKNEKNGSLIVPLIEKAVEAIFSTLELPERFLNKRHEQQGKNAVKQLQKAQKEWKHPEIAAHFLKKGITELDEIMGTTNPEEILNRIFDSFCIGK